MKVCSYFDCHTCFVNACPPCEKNAPPFNSFWSRVCVDGFHTRSKPFFKSLTHCHADMSNKMLNAKLYLFLTNSQQCTSMNPEQDTCHLSTSYNAQVWVCARLHKGHNLPIYFSRCTSLWGSWVYFQQPTCNLTQFPFSETTEPQLQILGVLKYYSFSCSTILRYATIQLTAHKGL